MSVEALSGIKGIDTAQGLTNCMDDEELYLSIVVMYIDQLAEYYPQMDVAYANQNWEEIGKLAHSIKGASASVGAFDIQKASAEIEQAAKENQTATITDNFSSFVSLLNTTCDELKQHL